MSLSSNTSRSVRALAIFIVGIICLPLFAFAVSGTPKILNYQGRLMDANGTLLGGTGTEYCFKFSFYDNASVGSGSKLWPSSAPSTMTATVKNGVFNVGIGDTNVGGDVLDFNFQDTDTVYLNVDVATKVGATCAAGDGAESFETLGPRPRIYSSGFAINASTLGGLSASQILSSAFSTTSAEYWKLQNSFFSTTSAEYWKSATNFFSTTSIDFWKSQNNFFSTTSADFYLSQNQGAAFSTTSASYLLATYDKGYFFSTTSADYWKLANNFFSTTSANYWKSATDFFSTTSIAYWKSVTDLFSTTSTNYFVDSSSTIPKTYANNSFTGTQTFVNASTTHLSATYASSTQGFFGSLSVGSLTGILKAVAGVVTSALVNLASDVTGILQVANGGTGWANLAAGAVLYGNGTDALATTTPALPGQTLAYLNNVPTWTSTTTFSNGLVYANGNVTLDTSGDWSGTFDGKEGSFYLANSFSTTSADYYLSQANISAFSTTSADYWKSERNFFSTTSADSFLASRNLFSTTSTDYFVSQRSFFSTTSADYYTSQNNFFSTTSAEYLLATYDKGYFFSTTSADYWKLANNFFSTTSSDFWKSQTSFFSTTSAEYHLGQIDKGYFFSTTSNDFFITQRNFFSTSSVNFWKSVTDLFSTTSADYFVSQRNFFSTSSADYLASQRNYFSTTSASHFADSSTTIPKTYTDNIFTGTQTFSTASTTNLIISSLTSGLLKTGPTGVVALATPGTDYLNSTAGDWTGTLNGYTVAQITAAGFSTTSADYWKTQNNFFSTTSADAFLAQRNLFSTTSVDYFTSQRNFFSTTSADAFVSARNLFSTTSSAYFLSQYQGAAFSTTSADEYVHSSTTIPKTYSTNTFTGANTFNGLLTFNYSSSTLFSSFATASTTNLTISSVPSTLLKTDAAGKVVAAVAGSDYLTSANIFSYPFTASRTFSTSTAATTTSIWSQGVFLSSSTVAASQFPYASSTAFTTGSLFSTNLISTYGAITNASTTALSGTNLFFANATSTNLNFTNLLGTFATIINASTTAVSGTNFSFAAGTTTNFNTTNLFSTYTTITNASTTALTAGNLFTTNATTSNLAVTNITSSLLKTNSSGSLVAAVAGTDYAVFGYPFTAATQFGAGSYSTSTLIGFTNGILSLASTTIGNGTQYGGLTVSGGATTTGNAYFGAEVGLASSSPWGLLSIQANGLGSAPAFAIGSSSATYFMVNNGGRVGVGTTSPGATFAVQGTGLFSNIVSTGAATSSFQGPVSVGIARPSSLVSILGGITGPTSATGTAIVSISNDNNTLSSGNNVLRLNLRTALGTACVAGTTCPRYIEFFTGAQAGTDNTGTGVGRIQLSTAGTGITQTSGAADFAEYMQLNSSASVGDIVSLNSSGEYQKAVAGQSLIGVISDNPAFVGNAGIEGNTNAYIVGFAGVIETSVSDANGPIAAGDFIAASSTTAGVGVKLLTSGYTLGQALESWPGPGTGTIKVLVLPKYIDAAVALESYGGSGGGVTGYWDLSTSTGRVSLASSTYSLVVTNASLGYASTTAISSDYASSTRGFFGSLSIGNLSGILKATAGTVSTSLVNLASDVTGVLSIANGGTGTSTAPTYGKLLVGNTSGGYDYVATSSLGINSGVWGQITGNIADQADLQNALDAKLSLSAWYSTTTDQLAEGSVHKYYTDARVLSYVSGIEKGFFFSTTSADIWKGSRDFFSTTSAQYLLSVSNLFSTTSTDYWKSQNNFFSTTSADAFVSARNLFSTTSSAYFLSQYQGAAFSTTSADEYVHSSTTIPKTYSTNTFTGANTFNGLLTFNYSSSTLFSSFATASTTNLTISSVPSTLLKTDAAGKVVAAVAGVDYATAASVGAAYAFQGAGNSTSTLTQFNGGLTSYASTTIGNGTVASGLTINGTATTTNLIFTGLTSALLKVNAQGQVMNAVSGVDYAAFGYPFVGNATTTLISFNGGLGFSNATGTALFANVFTSNQLAVGGTGTTTINSSGVITAPAINATYASSTAISVSGTIYSGTASTSNLTISNLTNGLLKVGATGNVSLASVGTDYLTSATIFSYPFATSRTFATTTAATTSSIWSQGVFFSSSTVAASQFPYASSTAFTTGSLFTTNITNTGSAALGNASTTALSGTNSLFANSTTTNLNFTNALGTYFTITNASTTALSGTNFSFAAGTTTNFNAVNEVITGRSTIANASTTALSGSNFSFVNGTTTSFNTGNLAITNLVSTLLKTDSTGNLVAAVAGSDYLTGSTIFGFPFTPTTFGSTVSNATSTLIGFTNGLYALASSTIGNGTQAGGLYVSGGATTTGSAYFGGKIGMGTTSAWGLLAIDADNELGPLFTVGSTTSTYFVINNGGYIGIGTSTPGSPLSVGNVANFTVGTSSIYSTGGIDLSGGCFSIDGVCINQTAPSATNVVLSAVRTGTATSTWTVPSNLVYVVVELWGGGGGGGSGGSAAATTGGAGGTSNFGGFATSTGGSGGIGVAAAASTGGIGGTGVGGDINLSGGGGIGTSAQVSEFWGGGGGSSPRGGAGATSTIAAAILAGNSGSTFGGGGGGNNCTTTARCGPGGGGGGYMQKIFLASAFTGTTSVQVAVGAGGLGGPPATNGARGGNGANGGYVIYEYTSNNVSLGNGSVNYGTSGQFAFYNANGTTVSGTSNLFNDTTTNNIGIGTTTPWAALSVLADGETGPTFAVGSSSATYFLINNGGRVGIGTTTIGNKFAVEGSGIFNGFLTATGLVTANTFVATSTTIASQFPYASSTAVSGTNLLFAAGTTTNFNAVNEIITGRSTIANASTTALSGTNFSFANGTTTSFNSANLAITNLLSSLLKTDAQGNVVAAVAGTDYLNGRRSFDFGTNNFATATAATTSSIWSKGVFFSSSTVAASQFPYASSTVFSANNLFATYGSITNASTTALSGTNFSFTNGTTTSLNSTNLISMYNTLTNASTTALSGTNSLFANATTTNLNFTNGLGVYFTVANASTTALSGVNFLFNNGSTTNFNTNNLAIANLASTLLKTDLSGNVVAALAGADYLTSATIFSYPFATSRTFATTTAATTSSIWSQGVFFSSSTIAASQFPYASSTAFTTGNLFSTNLTSTYGTISNASTTALSGTNLFFANATSTNLNFTNLIGTYASILYSSSTAITTSGNAYFAAAAGSVGIGTTTVGNKLGVEGSGFFNGFVTATGVVTASNFNATSTQKSIFPYASSTALTAGELFSANATSTNLVTTSASTSILFGARLGTCQSGFFLTWSAGFFGCEQDQSSAGGAFPFIAVSGFGGPANATSAVMIFNNGIYTTSSSTVGNLSMQNATSTNATTTSLAITNIKNGLISVNANGSVGTTSLSTELTFTANTLSLNLANQNIWTGLQSFQGNASTTQISATVGYFGGTATTTIDSGGNIAFGSSTPWIIMQNGTDRALNFGTSTTNIPVLTISTRTSLNGLVGIGTTSPWGKFSVEMGPLNPAFVVSNSGSSSPAFYVSGTSQNGLVGIGTSSPWAQFAINPSSELGKSPILSIGSTSATYFMINNGGKVGIGSSTPWAILSVSPTQALASTTPLFAVGSSTATTSFMVASNGFVGIGTSSPNARFTVGQGREPYSVWVGRPGSTTPIFAITSQNSGGSSVLIGTSTLSTTTALVVESSRGSGMPVAAFSGTAAAGVCLIRVGQTSILCSSDVRLKHNINTFAPELSALMQLRPVTYNWNEEDASTTAPHIGFIAQEVLPIFPDLISTDLNGKYAMNYAGLTPILTAGLQTIDLRLETIASTTASSTPDSRFFAESFFAHLFKRVTEWLANATNGIGSVFAKAFHASNEICVDDQCLTRDDIRAMKRNLNQTAAAPVSSGAHTTNAPVIEIQGNNPATIEVGETYVDLGAIITGPSEDLNLGIDYLVDGLKTSQIAIDTSFPAEHVITYRVIDVDGNVSEVSRTVRVVSTASANESSATTTSETTTSESADTSQSQNPDVAPELPVPQGEPAAPSNDTTPAVTTEGSSTPETTTAAVPPQDPGPAALMGSNFGSITP